MSRDILSEYGPDQPSHERAPATNGGQLEVKQLPYSPPVGPKSIGDPKSPGLHGTNHGNNGTQGRR